MGDLRKALLCGYYDEQLNYIVEIDVKKLQKVVDKDYENFLTDMETKIKLYELLKYEFTKNLTPKCNEFVVELKGVDE